MPITVKHSKVSTIPDADDTSLVRPSDWNADHTLIGLGTMAEQDANNVNITGGSITGVSGLGDVTGPASATDNALVRFDSTTGKLVQNGNITEDDNGNLANINAVSFDTTPTTPPTSAGSMYWDTGNGTPSVILNNNVELQLGQENVALVYNNTASTIANGSVVAVNGAQGQRPAVVLADADSEPLSAGTLGIATENILSGAEGFVCTFGLVRGLDTSAFTAGDPIWLSTTAGQFTATRPPAPAHTVFLGWVIKVSASAGEIFVHISNGWELDELHNVKITSPTGGNLLSYDQTAGYWKNINLTDGTAISVTEATDGTVTIANTGVTALSAGTGISVSGSTGSVTVTNTAPDQTVALTAGTGISTSGTYPNFTITNTAPDQIVSLTGAGSTTVTGTYPSFTISSTGGGGGVTSVGATAPIASSGGTTPTISISQATTSTDGYLSSTDWNTFNNKQPAGTYVTSVGATSPVTSTGGTTPTIAMPAANGSTNGYLTSTDWTTFNNKGNGTVTSVSALTLGTTGTDVSSTVANSTTTPVITLNIPTASAVNRGALSSTDWTTFNNKGNGTVTSVAALTLGTTGTDLNSSVANGSTTPVITLNVPTASSVNRGALSSTDWSTFNGKQELLVSGTNIKTVNSQSLLGSGNITVTAAAGGADTEIQYNNAGALAGAANLHYDGANLGVGTTPDGTSWVQIGAGTATKAPLELITSAGTLMTTPDDGSIEYDGSVFYGTPIASSRGVMTTEHFVARTGTKTMVSNTNLQSLFGGGTGGLTNGALTVASTETYFFEASINMSSMSGTSGNIRFSIVGAGTATFTSAAFHAFGLDSTTQATAAAAGTSFTASQTATGNIVTAATGTAVSVYVKGIFRIDAAGTIIPSVQLTTAAAAVIGTNTWFKCYPVGSNTVISVGNWS